MAYSDQEAPSKVLIITTSGGGGHIQAARAKLLEIALKSNQPKSLLKIFYLKQRANFLEEK